MSVLLLVACSRPRWWKGAAFTEKTNVELEEEEFAAVDVESRGSEPNKQSNDPPPEFTCTKPNEFKSYRKKVKLWLLFTRTPAQLQGPLVLSRLTGPAWDACDGLEPEDVATHMGANVILDTWRKLCRVNMKRSSSMSWRTCETPRPCTSGPEQRTRDC